MGEKKQSDLLQDNSDEFNPFYYVGIGASAGGLEAIEDFFKNMPSNSGLAFIVVQHLSPDYKSLMVELLSKHTDMPIYWAQAGIHVKRNSIYLIPPKKNLSIFHGKLLLTEQDHSKGINLPIDVFLRSLAEDQAEKSIAIILSGTGSDGTRGIQAVKESGGMVIAQKEESAKFDGMPRSAIATGLTDLILIPSEMPQHLMGYVKYPIIFKAELSDALITDEDNLTRIFALLREKHKIDFTYYKPSTMIRRIEHRMTINQINDIKDYVRYLARYPKEITILYKELLIGVTNFFRDPDAYKALEEVYLPQLFKQRTEHEIRLWIAGCSTGEEAYSFAILCQECMEKLDKYLDVKIFATDVDGDTILKAGTGVYPESIVADVPPNLLTKYFYRKDDNTFHISRNIREMVVFAKHNLIKDPPFTNISLVSCRNLLIYLQPILQKKVFEMFSFSLVSQGILFLGTSETVGDMVDYFEPMEHKWKIFRSRGKRHIATTSKGIISQFERGYKVNPLLGGGGRQQSNRLQEEDRILEKILQSVSEDYFSCIFLVNEQLELIYTFGSTNKFLKLPSGKISNDITKMVVKELVIPLSTGIQKIFKYHEQINYSNIRLKNDGSTSNITMKIKFVQDKKKQDFNALVLIEETVLSEEKNEPSVVTYNLGEDAEQHIQDLEQELQFSRENLQATIEELETSNEELQATNEELLASNEELQSTNEELQSANEELYTVNAEYQKKITELTDLNNDINNLLSSSDVATLFIGENLEIRKFTPRLTEIFKIIYHDVGRPFTHISHNLININILNIVSQVQKNTQVITVEAKSNEGRWFLIRAFPYYIAPQTFSGVILTFVDITERKISEEKISFQANLLECVQHAVIATNLEGYIIYWNSAAKKLYEWSDEETMGLNITDIITPIEEIEHTKEFIKHLQRGESWEGELQVQNKSGNLFIVNLKNSPIYDENNKLVGIVSVSEKKRE